MFWRGLVCSRWSMIWDSEETMPQMDTNCHREGKVNEVDVLPRHKCRGFHLRIPLAHRGLG